MRIAAEEAEKKKKAELELVSAVAPTMEDAVQALMDHLVEPVLPIRHNPSPDLSLRQTVAKQMHAVVLLYNFYHRQQFPQLEFLDFESFCKVAVNAKPPLIAHLNHMQKCDDESLFKDNSLTKKAILDACNISKTLATWKNTSSMEGWPLSKIAVFLTDSVMEKCWLVYSARTEGVWSLIEKYENEFSYKSEDVLGTKRKCGAKRKDTRPVRFQNADETRLQQLAVSAVIDATGIDPTELMILESHVAYSLTEEKTTARLFIMKCKSVKSDDFQVPIKDAIDSLRGPFVQKSCNSYIAADSVDYFHLLPYAGTIADWFSREVLANGSELQREGNPSHIVSPMNEDPTTVVANINCGVSSGTCQVADLPVLKTNNNRNMDQTRNRDCPVNGIQNIDEGKSSGCSHPSWGREATSKGDVDNAGTKFSTESDLTSPKSSTPLEKNVAGSVREACHNDVDMEGNPNHIVSPMNEDPATIVANINCGVSSGTCQVADLPVQKTNNNRNMDQTRNRDCPVNGIQNIDEGKSSGCSHPSWGREATSKGDVDNAGTKFSTESDLTSPKSSTPLEKNVAGSVREACHNDVDMEKTLPSGHVGGEMSGPVMKWRKAEDIQVEILTQRNEFLTQARKRQCMRIQDCSSEIEVETCRDEVGLDSDKRMNGFDKRSGQSTVGDNGIEGLVSGSGLDSPMIPLQKDVSLVGSVSFSRQYTELYRRIVERFGDILEPESMEATLCTDIVSATMNGLFEVVDSMLQASPRTVDARVLESWEMKLRFCELAGLKVGWLRDHFERIRQAFTSADSTVIEELEGHASLLAEDLEVKRKRVADLVHELEMARGEEKAALEKKKTIDTDLEAAKKRRDSFSFSLF